MFIRKTKSLPINMNKLISQNISTSFHNFNLLNLNGSQKHLTFGQYSNKKDCAKQNKKKVIQYFYSKL